ncbi:hypothetical protein TorRG33x02_207910 [Trema orientale]|uniref:Uncharacterized protein n=1 Tax=Trema orientale TaxID=63057 RepID=A0A2P5ECV5_TREOI|nr:hypothetical protein TorRG33x02_207910 [Trema orientale]
MRQSDTCKAKSFDDGGRWHDGWLRDDTAFTFDGDEQRCGGAGFDCRHDGWRHDGWLCDDVAFSFDGDERRRSSADFNFDSDGAQWQQSTRCVLWTHKRRM